MEQVATSQGQAEGRRLMVTRLASYTQKKDLLKAFQPYGIEHAVVLRKPTGNHAFLTFGTKEQATTAMAQTFTIHKRKLRLLYADPWHEAKLIKPRPAVNPFPGLELREKISLPVECISHIARFLPFQDRARLEQVSRRWRLGTLASFHEIRHLDLTDWRWPDGWSGKEVSTEAFYWLVQRAQHIQTLTVTEETLSQRLRPQIIPITIKNAPELTDIDITAAPIRPSAIRHLAETSVNLEHLGIGECLGNIEADLGRALEKAAHLKSFKAVRTTFGGRSLLHLRIGLESLTIYRCKGLRAEILQEAIGRFQKLEHLELNFCEPLPDNGILVALTGNMALHQTLKTLKIHAYTFAEAHHDQEALQEANAMDVEAAAFVELDIGPAGQELLEVQSYTQLLHLSLTFCAWVTGRTVREIAERIPQIEQLNLSGCTNIRTEDALDPLDALTRLRILEVNDMYPTLQANVFGRLHALEKLHCRNNPGINEEQICGAIRNCPHLTVIDVEGCASIGKALLVCARNMIRRSSRSSPLAFYMGGTALTRQTKLKSNFLLRVFYDRRFEPMFS